MHSAEYSNYLSKKSRFSSSPLVSFTGCNEETDPEFFRIRLHLALVFVLLVFILLVLIVLVAILVLLILILVLVVHILEPP